MFVNEEDVAKVTTRELIRILFIIEEHCTVRTPELLSSLLTS